MGRLIGGLLDNDSPFGRIMTKIGIIIGANLMFVLFSLPVVTIGPGIAALHYCMLKCLREGGTINPFKTFWAGFKMNFKQALICSLGAAVIAAVLVLDIRFCTYYGGPLVPFKYACYALLLFLIIEMVYLFPVMAAFDDTIGHLLRNALFFASRRPLKMLLAVAIHVIPVAVTIIDTHMRPLYGFLWVVCAAGLIAMMMAELLLKDFEQYLPSADPDQESEPEEIAGTSVHDTVSKKTQREILKEMKKLDK